MKWNNLLFEFSTKPFMQSSWQFSTEISCSESRSISRTRLLALSMPENEIVARRASILRPLGIEEEVMAGAAGSAAAGNCALFAAQLTLMSPLRDPACVLYTTLRVRLASSLSSLSSRRSPERGDAFTKLSRSTARRVNGSKAAASASASLLRRLRPGQSSRLVRPLSVISLAAGRRYSVGVGVTSSSLCSAPWSSSATASTRSCTTRCRAPAA